MNFLNLWALSIAAAVVPALLILYFLKLRRRLQPVPSTLLWKRAVQDLQVNAPFQRLRRNLLLLLQLIVLVLAILALARPIVESTITSEERVVLLIDRSASMNTVEADGRTRLDEAKEQAVRQVRTFNRRSGSWSSLFDWAGGGPQTQVMVVAFNDRATIAAPFTTNSDELERVIRAIEPTDGRTDAREALDLAKAYLLPPTMFTPGMESTPTPSERPAKIVLISDGKVENLSQASLRGGDMLWLPIGQARDNVGVTAMRTQRRFEQPEILDVFVAVQNFGDEPVKTDLAIYVDGRLSSARAVDLGPRSTPAAGDQPAATAPAARGAPASASIALELTLDRAATVEARLIRSDALAVDNAAFAVTPAPRKLRVLVVTEKNQLLDILLGLLPLAESPFIKPAEWEANAGGAYGDATGSGFDVVIFDRYSPERLPPGSYAFIRGAPPLPGVSTGEVYQNAPFVWWDEASPLLRHVALEHVNVFEAVELTLPNEAEVLAEAGRGPVIARYAADGRNCLMLGFALENTDWWSKQSLPIFLYNGLRYMGGAGGVAEVEPSAPGDTLRIAGQPAGQAFMLTRPDGGVVELVADASGAAYFGGSARAGVYRVVDVPAERAAAYAVNLADAGESDITPPTGPLTVEGDRKIGRLDAIETSTPEVWRWFVGAALLVVLAEWWLYNRRVSL